MLRQNAPTRQQTPLKQLAQVGQWLLPFIGLVIAIWLATRSREAPQISLLILLYVIAINFSIPLTGHITSTIVPVVIVSSFLVVGFNISLAVLAGGFLLAELTRPLWYPLWQNTPLRHVSWRQRLSRFLIHLIALVIAGQTYILAGGEAPLPQAIIEIGRFTPLLYLAGTYALVYSLLTLLVRQVWGNGLQADGVLNTLMVAVLTQPFALFGAITFSDIGLPAFVIFCIGAGAFAIISWLSWYRNFVLNERMMQFATLNDIGVSLRESLDLATVLQRTYEQVNGLVPAGRFAISLIENGTWSQPLLIHQGHPILPTSPIYQPDHFTQWVATHNRVLDLDPQNMPFATRHNLTPPTPQPAMWLGVPLTTAQQVTGVMVLQRYDNNQPFSRWSREVLLAIAGQVSAAIQNARLYSQTDEALAQRVQQLQALLNSTYEGVLLVNTAGEIVLINPMAASLIGQPQTDLLHQPLAPAGMATALGFDHNELSQRLQQLPHGTIPTNQRTLFQTHLPPLNSDTEPTRRFIERTDTPVLGQNQHILGWLMVFHDVTETQERAEWRTNATRMIVHDLRNPISTLLSTIDLLDHEQSSGRGTNLVHAARRVSTDMLDLVDSLMDMTRLEAGQLVVDAEAMNLARLAENVVAYMRPLAGQQQITLHTNIPPNMPAVWADQEVIRRVCINLLDNALKFTPAGGHITTLITPHPAQPNHHPGLTCAIEDTGLGIPAEHKAAIFDRFVRVNPGGAQIRGTGLGLTFCKLAIEAHNGKIWVEDVPAGGSRFIFTLPGIPHFT